MKIISWNVNGIRAVVKKGFIDFVKKENPDILCLQEIKTHEVSQTIADEMHALNYADFWNFAKKPGYSGTAIFVKKSVLEKNSNLKTQIFNQTQNLNVSKLDHLNFNKNLKFKIKNYHGVIDTGFFGDEGRVLALEFDNFYLINAYFPHTRRNLSRLDFKMEFNKKFLEFISNLRHSGLSRIDPKERFPSSGNDNPTIKQFNNLAIKPVIICGDLNVAHREIDLTNPKQNVKNAGFLPQERAWMDKLLASGYIDTFREFTKDGGHYTWWSHFANARARNIGWRIDYFIVSNDLKNKVKSSTIFPQIFGSDHAPVIIEIEL